MDLHCSEKGTKQVIRHQQHDHDTITSHTFASIFQQSVISFTKYGSHVSGIGGCYAKRLSTRKVNKH